MLGFRHVDSEAARTVLHASDYAPLCSTSLLYMLTLSVRTGLIALSLVLSGKVKIAGS